MEIDHALAREELVIGHGELSTEAGQTCDVVLRLMHRETTACDEGAT